MKCSTQDIQEFLQCTDEDEDEVFLNFFVSDTTAGAGVGQKSPPCQEDSQIRTSSQPAADRGKRENPTQQTTVERSSSSKVRDNSSHGEGCLSLSSVLFNEYEIQSDNFDQADEAYLNAYIENAEKICKEYTELTACEAKVVEFETEIVLFQRKLDVTGEIVLMQEQIEEVLRRKGHRNQVSDSLNEVYSALQEVDSFCDWIVKNHAHQKVDEVYLSYLHRLGVKLTFLSRHKALHHSAVDDEIRPKLTAAAFLAGEKILGYIASRIHQVQWEAPPPASSSTPPTSLTLRERRCSAVDGEANRESTGDARAGSMPGSRNRPSLDGVANASTSSLSLGSASLSVLPARPLFSPHVKGMEKGIVGANAHLSHSTALTMAGLHESLEQGEHFGLSFLKLYNPPVAKRIVLLYLQQGAMYYQNSFSAALHELIRFSSVYRQNSSGRSENTDATPRLLATGDAPATHRSQSSVGRDGGERPSTTGPSSSSAHVENKKHTPAAANAHSSQKETKEMGSLANPTNSSDKPLTTKMSRESAPKGKRKEGKDALPFSSSFLYASFSHLRQEAEEWRTKLALCTTNVSSTDAASVPVHTSDPHSLVSVEVGAEWNVQEYLRVLNAIHFKYGELHYEPFVNGEWERNSTVTEGRGSLPRAAGTAVAASTTSWLSQFISVLLLFVNTCTEECRFIANFFCLAETQDGAVENYNDAEKIAKLLLEPLLDRFQPLLHSCLPQVSSALPTISLSSSVKRQYVIDSLAAIRVLELCKGHLSASQDPIPLLLLSGVLESCRGLLHSSLSSMLAVEFEGFSQEVRSIPTSPFPVSCEEETENTQQDGSPLIETRCAEDIPPFLRSLLLSIWSLDTLNTVPLRASTFHMEVPPVSEKEVDRFCVSVSHLVIELLFRVAGVESTMHAGDDKEPEGESTHATRMAVPAKVATSSASAHFLLFAFHHAWYLLRSRTDASSAALVVLPDKQCGGGTIVCWRDAVQQSLALQPWLYTIAPQLAHVSQWWWKWKSNAISSTFRNDTSGWNTPHPSSAMQSVHRPTHAAGAATLCCRTLGDSAVIVASCYFPWRPTDLVSVVKNGRGIPVPAMYHTMLAGKTPKELSPSDRQEMKEVVGPLLRGEIAWKKELRGVWAHLRTFSVSPSPSSFPPSRTATRAHSAFPSLPSASSSRSALPLEVLKLFTQDVLLPILQTLPPTCCPGSKDAIDATAQAIHQSTSFDTTPPSTFTHQYEKGEKRVERSHAALSNANAAANEVDTDTLEEGDDHGGRSGLASSSSATFQGPSERKGSRAAENTTTDDTVPPPFSTTENGTGTTGNDRNEKRTEGEEPLGKAAAETVPSSEESFTALAVERFLETCVEEEKKWNSIRESQKTTKKKKKKEE